MVVKSNSISTERELEPVRWERIDKIKSLIKGKNIAVSEDNIDFSLKLLKGFTSPWYPSENSLDGVNFSKFQIWYSFLENKIILIKGERLDDIKHQNILDKDVLYLGTYNLNQSRKSKKLIECYSLIEYNDSWGMKKKSLKLTDEDSAKKFIVEYLTKRVREKLKLVCEHLYFEDSKYYSNQIAFIELLGEIARSSFNSNAENVVLGLAEITGELAGGRFMNSAMSTLNLSTSFFFSTGTKGKFVQLLFSKLLESATKDFNKKELESLVYDFQNGITIGKVGRSSVFLGDAYNKKLILEELDSFIKNKELDKLSEFNLDIDLVYNLTSKNNSITFGHSTVDLAILKSISNNIPVKIGGSLFIRLEFETILKLLIDEVDFNYQSTMDHITIIKEIRDNNPGKVKVILENSEPELFSKQIDYLRVGIENGIYDEFEKPKILLEFINLILELMKN